MPRPDLAVVGAGPSGSAAAWHLARAGARVTIFDASHPREKPCGGGLSARAVRLVRELVGGTNVDGVSIRGLRFGSGPAGEGRTAIVPLSGAEPLVVVSRAELDGLLLRAAMRAGARHVRERVIDVRTGGGGVGVATTGGRYEFAGVLGADGATSLVRRRLVAPFDRTQFSITAGCYVRGRSFDEIVIRSYCQPPGYLWSFPRPDHVAVGVCARAEHVGSARNLRSVLTEWLAHALPADGSDVRPYSWPIPSLSSADLADLRVSGDRWFLLGDAAGLVDPLTREGIYFALESGRLAAEALIEGREPGAAYAARVKDGLRPELARAAALQSTFFSSGFSDLLVEALARSAPVREIMADLVAGSQPYATLRRRLLATFEVGLAWRLFQLQLKGMVAPPAERRAM
jgi:menaquinone-9 beta-reductase